jgi:DNA-dependent RNA polymerase auxiliary subunit epsilon
MGYIIKNTQGLIVTRLTDTGRKKLSEGNFNIAYFQVGDSEVNYNKVSNTYNKSNFQILEPSYNAQNSTGIPASNKNDIK